ncbi:MAG: nucleotidyltransferase family protein [Bacteroidia bacterium]
MTSLNQILETLKQHKPYLHEKYGVSEIGVFGSYTRNDFTDKSDVDILVDFDRGIGMGFISLADELEQILNNKVDLLSKGGIKSRYWPYIQKDLIYV